MTSAGGDVPSPSGSTADSRLSRLERAEGRQIDEHLRPFFVAWLDTFVFHGRIDAKLRELTILRVMWRCGQPYEWGNHYRLARQAGCSDEEIVAIRTPHPTRNLTAPVVVVVQAADEVVDFGYVLEDTMTAASRLFPEPGVLEEFLYLVAGYRMYASVSASTRDTRDGPRWPPDGIGPTDLTRTRPV